jgi:hypothetical protein
MASAPSMMGLLLVAFLVALFLVDKPADVGLAGCAYSIAALAARLTDRMRDARDRLVEARA